MSKTTQPLLIPDKYQIRWFDSKNQRIKDQIFEGPDAYEKAIKWGKKTLVNFNTDLINSIN